MKFSPPCACPFAAVLFLGAFVGRASAEIKLPAILSDHMLLQRESEVALWGWAAPGAKVEIRGDFLREPALAVADSQGAFRASVRTGAAGGPHALEFREGAGGPLRKIEDIWFGELWLCGGQSNMEMPLAPVDGYTGVRDWQKELACAELPMLRCFDVPNTHAAGPASDCGGRWVLSTPDSAQHISATGFFFGREIQRELGVPVGLVGVNWGGTPAQAWTSGPKLATFPDYAREVARLAEFQRDPEGAQRKIESQLAAWIAALGDAPTGKRDEANGWKSSAQPGLWTGELESFDGVVLLARSVVIPPDWAGKELVLELGAIDDMDTTWFDGVRIGGMERTGAWSTPRSYRVPKRLATPGEHELLVRVVDTGGYGGLSGKPEELRMYPVGDESSARPLAGTWRCRPGKKLAELPAFPETDAVGPWTPSALYNGMLAPLFPLRIRGALFYQGESNRYDARGYAALLRAMIESWRAGFAQGDFPFYLVQIAPFGYGDHLGASGFLRESQRATAEALPNCGMAVTMDVGDERDIHPLDKQTVGHRLALLALARTYGRKELECCGPTLTKAAVEGKSLRVTFAHAAGLAAQGGAPAHFTLAGKDGRFEAAEARIEGESVVLSSALVPEPLYVRYAWCEACETNLANGAGLPAVPFRTDSFEQ